MQSFTNVNQIIEMAVSSLLHNSTGTELNNITNTIKFIFDLILNIFDCLCDLGGKVEGGWKKERNYCKRERENHLL